MYARPNMSGTAAQRVAAAAPLAIFLAILGVASWAGREQLKAAVEASGAFVAAQFGQGRPEKFHVKPTATVTQTVETPKVSEEVAATAVAGSAADTARGKVIVEIDDKGRKLQILDVAIPEDCYPHQHADYAGDAVVWGLGHKKTSAAECCAACKEHQLKVGDNMPCNIWVWCGDPSGICWTMDIHNHTTGDCWLKHQAKWDNNPDRSKSNLEINHQGAFSSDFRAVHKTAPELVPWVAGVVPVKSKAAVAKRRLRAGA
ncbi:hypothetical protein Vretimale_7682 [Volvox reticuliferus]|uniref:Uncharacterized protein n=1 Tax=Volvox reticuliferus TaxID=1737510 RepID=A0A8J4FNS0_9CHLO|nr:hypothetical protein Vretifemale_7762 [Volvox reticuliferus]GIM02855.1 hypothetical protein Vretimale_7682 [Volvox reticuliferus]